MAPASADRANEGRAGEQDGLHRPQAQCHVSSHFSPQEQLQHQQLDSSFLTTTPNRTATSVVEEPSSREPTCLPTAAPSDNGVAAAAASQHVSSPFHTEPSWHRSGASSSRDAAITSTENTAANQQHCSSGLLPEGGSCNGSSNGSPASPGAPPAAALPYSLAAAAALAAAGNGGVVQAPPPTAAAAPSGRGGGLTPPSGAGAAQVPCSLARPHSPPHAPACQLSPHAQDPAGRDSGGGGGGGASPMLVTPVAAASAAAGGVNGGGASPSFRLVSQASPGVLPSPTAADAAAAGTPTRCPSDGGLSGPGGSGGGAIGWSVQQQQQQQQQAAAATAAAVAAGLPLLAVPAAGVSYTPWGPVIPSVQVPAALVAGGGSSGVAAAAAGGASGYHLPLLALAGSPPAGVIAAGVPADAAAHAAAALQLAAAAAAAAAAPQAPPALAVTAAAAAAAAATPDAAMATAAAAASPHLRLAAVLRQGGKLAEALALVESVLLRQPGCVEALFMRAQCLQALGQVQEALAAYHRVLAAAPDHIPCLTALGGLLQSQGLLGEAVAAYRRAHELRPDDAGVREGLAVVLTDQGTKLKDAGAPLTEAVSRYQAAAALHPRYAPALYNLGVVAGELRQAEAAEEYYRAAVAADPRYAQAHCNMGVLLRERGRLREAVEAYERALAAAPNFAIVRNNLALALTDLGTHVKNEGRVEEGIALYERALSYVPRHADALYNLGVAYGEKGDLQRAAFMYEMALAFNPACAEAHNNLGVIWKEQDQIERAVECYGAALALRPDFPQSLNNLGVVMTAQGRAAEALTLLAAAVAASPSYTEAHNNLGVLQRDVGCIPEALTSYSRCLELDPGCRNAGQNRLLALNYIYQGEDDVVCSAHRQWGEHFQSGISPMPPLGPADRSWDPDRPLRIGYISPDLFTHSVSYFAEAPLSHHCPARGFQHIIYSCVPKPDAKTVRLRNAAQAAGGVWRDVAGLSEAQLAEMVRADEVDLLVELTGHTANNRLGCMARRPAPLQLTWIGYPNSTGLAAVDYRITDEVCDPWDTRQSFVEQLVRLPGGCFLCYTPACDAPPVSPPPALANGFITFGSFNNLAKITPQVLRVWGAILSAVPRSRLVLKNKPFACEAARAHVMRQLQQVGIEPWRVDLLPLAPGNAQHLASYALMDISLDPFPYAGTTTTTESLYMGVPCVTLAGRCHAHNVGVSLLAAVGLHSPPPPPYSAPTATAMEEGCRTHPSLGGAASGASCGSGTGSGSAISSSSGEATDAANGSSSLSPPSSSVVSSPAIFAGSSNNGGSNANSSSDMIINNSSCGNHTPSTAIATGSGSSSGSTTQGPGWVATSEEEYVALAVAHASDVQALAALRSTLRQRMLASRMCAAPTFVRGLEDVYRALWRRHCAHRAGDEAAAAAVAVAAGIRPQQRA